MDFVEKAKELFGKGAKASKEAMTKAGSAIQDFSDKSVVKLEIKQLENKMKAYYTDLGKLASDSFLASPEKTFSMDSDGVSEIMKEINNCRDEIQKRQKALEEF